MLKPHLDDAWLKSDWDNHVIGYTVKEVVPRHVEDVRTRRIPQIAKVEQEVKVRLQREINFWDRRAQDLKAQEDAGKKTRLPAKVAQDRADALSDRMKRRLAELDRERAIIPRPPQVKGGCLVIPGGLLRRVGGLSVGAPPDEANKELVERLAMQAVMEAERALGREPRDASAERGLGYDIESKDLKTGGLFFIEVKGRSAGSDQVTLTRTEVLCALNEPDRFRLAIVVVDGETAQPPVYVREFDFGQPGFAQTAASYNLKVLLDHGGPPA